MKLPPLYRRLLADALDAGREYELALAAGMPYRLMAWSIVPVRIWTS